MPTTTEAQDGQGNRVLYGVLVEETLDNQGVQTDDGQVYFLSGMTRAAGAKVGDRIRLTYKTGPSYGLYFGQKVQGEEEEEKGNEGA